ncbi:unnamed protein product [Prorocentrum cordatum]|uniref:EF-hand domain-containing protein n=1 Tax=Prorocentrum cordatum TaxID=2364126 RepID=A0ABN9X9T4_9DINO|nr:unnamed protein product [Polarella glacialis]
MAETALQGGEKAKILALFRRFDDAGSGTLDEDRADPSRPGGPGPRGARRARGRGLAAARPGGPRPGREGPLRGAPGAPLGGRGRAARGPRGGAAAPRGRGRPGGRGARRAGRGPPGLREDVPGPVAAGAGRGRLPLPQGPRDSGQAQHDVEGETMVATGQPYELSVCERTSTSIGRTVVVDTPPYGHGARSERPLRPQGTRIPQWLSIVLNAHGLQSKAVVLTVDGTDTPLWEDDAHCADIAALIAALRRESVGVSVAVTKLGRQREIALYDASHGKHHGGQVGRDPRSGYETFASRYVEKVGAALRAKVSRIDDAAEELEQPSFLCAGKTIFDVPTWSGADEFKSWQQKRGTAEPPNFSYATARLRRLLQSTSEQAPPASASARL